jgi:ribonuclease-3
MHSAEPEKKQKTASAEGGQVPAVHETAEKLKELEQIIGISFHNKELLRQALSHSSYANEHRAQDAQNNERLEFLGDAVLELISSKFLYLAYPQQPEGDMTKLRASIVCEPTLALCAREFHLPDYLLLGKGEERTGGRRRNSIVSDALEALIGAIFLDSGIEQAEHFIQRFVLNDIEHKKLFYDSKTILQEVVQGEHEKLSYVLLEEVGPDHDKSFTVGVLIGNKQISTGKGHTKKAAEQEAAYKALLQLKPNLGE